MHNRLVMVTGANGFIGGHLIARLQKSLSVFCVSANDSVPFEGIPCVKVTWGEPLPRDMLPQRLYGVVHLAAIVGVEAETRPMTTLNVNTKGTADLWQYAQEAKAESFIYASTGDVYAPNASPSSENSPTRPASLYAMSKLLGEMCMRPCSDLRPTVLRLFHPYGPRENNRRLIPRLIARIKAGEAISLPSHSGPRLSHIYIDDVVNIVEWFLSTGFSGTYNIAHEQTSGLRDVCDVIGRALNRVPVFTVQPNRTEDHVANVARLVNKMGKGPGTSLQQGIKRLVETL